MSRTIGSMSVPNRTVAGGGSAPKAASSPKSGTLGKPSDAALAAVWRNRLRVVFMEGVPADVPVPGPLLDPVTVRVTAAPPRRSRPACLRRLPEGIRDDATATRDTFAWIG